MWFAALRTLPAQTDGETARGRRTVSPCEIKDLLPGFSRDSSPSGETQLLLFRRAATYTAK
jgi:hypothetical protein